MKCYACSFFDFCCYEYDIDSNTSACAEYTTDDYRHLQSRCCSNCTYYQSAKYTTNPNSLGYKYSCDGNLYVCDEWVSDICFCGNPTKPGSKGCVKYQNRHSYIKTTAQIKDCQLRSLKLHEEIRNDPIRYQQFLEANSLRFTPEFAEARRVRAVQWYQKLKLDSAALADWKAKQQAGMTVDVRARISEQILARNLDVDYWLSWCEANRLAHQTQDFRDKISKCVNTRWLDPIYQNHFRKALQDRGPFRTEVEKFAYSESQSEDMKYTWKHLTEADRIQWIHNIMVAGCQSPNGAEKQILACDNRLRFVGDGHDKNYYFKFSPVYYQFTRKRHHIPDFIITTNNRKLINLFGNHVHTIEEAQLLNHEFALQGYACLIIWFTTWRDAPDYVKTKICSFISNLNIESEII